MMDKQHFNFEKMSYVKHKHIGMPQDLKYSYLVIKIDGEGTSNECLEAISEEEY